MQDRQRHQREVRAFLQKHFFIRDWKLTLPHGWGNETYYATSNQQAYFVKLGVQISRYQIMASIGLTPQLLAAGSLDDGVSILVQPFITGRNPSPRDYQTHIEQIAGIIDRVHHNLAVQRVLPAVSSDLYSVAGSQALARLQQRWNFYRVQVPQVAEFVDESLSYLAGQVQLFSGIDLVASHNDICNANWLISSEGLFYLIDLESMTLDDPAVDIGAILWWYYPPELRPRFLELTGHADDEMFKYRMHVRMVMHCLAITLPREHSFDRFDPAAFPELLTDFRAILAKEENPQGYAG